ncbi:DUF4129 domain-containing protein [Citricoccus sp. GCM10030269]|uniref:DUF4129 domain-containing protein n=1 Tax=Citricoccus sp. GCM10030269 TaxID=3273388 RepID=UPI00362441EC
MITTTATPPPDGWQPDREEARRLLQDELAHPDYARAEPNPVLEWFRDALAAIGDWLSSVTGASPSWPVWILPLILVAVAVVVLVLVRPRPPAAARTSRDTAVLSDRTVTPEEHRRAAQAAFAAGDHSAALVSWYRALVRHAEERTILDHRPGRTATEAAQALGAVFPAERSALASAAIAFNAVIYGHRTASSAQATAIRDLEERLREATLETAHAGGQGGAGGRQSGLAVPR